MSHNLALFKRLSYCSKDRIHKHCRRKAKHLGGRVGRAERIWWNV